MATYYEILDIPKTASESDIKTAYRKAVMKWHPDKNPGDIEAVDKFKQVTEAYETLSDPLKKSHYDLHGTVGSSHSSKSTRSHPGFRNFHDAFDQVFGGNIEKGQNVQVRIEIELHEAATGCTKKIAVNKKGRCATCNGLGGTTFDTCHGCGGLGERIFKQPPFQVHQSCTSCHGSGKVVKNKCDDCIGTGFTPGQDSTIDIRIPVGIVNGMQVRVAGGGEVGRNGAPPGDLFVVILFKEHPLYHAQAYDILCDIWLSYTQLVLGYDVTIPDLFGNPISLKIPPGTHSGTRFRLREQGLPDAIGQKGDLLALIRVETPKEISEEYQVLIKQLADLEAKQVTPEREAFVKKTSGVST